FARLHAPSGVIGPTDVVPGGVEQRDRSIEVSGARSLCDHIDREAGHAAPATFRARWLLPLDADAAAARSLMPLVAVGRRPARRGVDGAGVVAWRRVVLPAAVGDGSKDRQNRNGAADATGFFAAGRRRSCGRGARARLDRV